MCQSTVHVVRFPVNRPFVLNVWEAKNCTWFGTANPCVVQGSSVFSLERNWENVKDVPTSSENCFYRLNQSASECIIDEN